MVKKEEWNRICDLIHKASHEYKETEMEIENISKSKNKCIILLPGWQVCSEKSP